MNELIIYFRNQVIKFIYKNFFRKIFFRIDPETTHNHIIKIGQFLGSFYFLRKSVSVLFCYSNTMLNQNILGIFFKNPIGLAAGFDKNAQLVQIIPSVGFGFMEVGSITAEASFGNTGKRLWRLIKSEGLVVNYGLNNYGCAKISERLRNKVFDIPLGTSIAKTNNKDIMELEAGITDYIKSYRRFTEIGSYFVINISCPNSPTGCFFDDAPKLDNFLSKIDKIFTQKPVFLKLSPDLTMDKIDDTIKVAEKHRIAGFICSNITKNRNNPKIVDKDISPKGGISGKPVRDLSDELIRYVYKKTKGNFVIIGCGGIFSAEDAYKKIRLGASVIQLITGMIFEGPQLISEINLGIVQLLKKDGFKDISQAVGIDNK